MTDKSIAGSARVMDIPADQLVEATNIRHDVDRQQIDEMKASIRSSGVLQNLIAAPRTSDGVFAVFGGRTRLVSIKELIAEGDLPSDFQVPTMIFQDIDPESADAIALAMAENMVRTQMDYVDECAAMAQLAGARKSEDEIAAIFGYRTRAVHERLLIAQLVPAAHRIVREKIRPLDWARALTLADAAMQTTICDDIASNPTAWATGADIRKFLTQSTIPAAHAMFDIAEYKGEIVTDMFEGDKLSDLDEFWRLQNEAIDDLSTDIEAEGFSSVQVLKEPFSSWLYEDEPDNSKAMAFIEVMPTGAVTVIRNKRPMKELAEETATLDEGDLDTVRVGDEIVEHEVRPTPSMQAYAAAHRTAMLQVEMAKSFRMSLEYSVIAMIGHRSAAFAIQPFTIPGVPLSHVGGAFREVSDLNDAIREAMPSEAPTLEQREQETVAMVRSMSDEQLQSLFTLLTAQRIGQTRRRGTDDDAASLANVFGEHIDVRSLWTPDQTFFEQMSSEDLRRLATVLLDSKGASATRFASAKKKDLVRALADNFLEAKEGTLPTNIAHRLNSWVPGIMSFPALVQTKADASEDVFEGEDEIDDLLFEGVDEDAAA